MEEKILQALQILNEKMDGMARDITDLKGDVSALKDDVAELKKKTNTIMDRTADLVEFRTEIRNKLENIEDSLEVLGKENFKNKVELVGIKKKIAQ